MLPQDEQPELTDLQRDGSDQSLMLRYRKGDEDAATELYVRYARRLQSLANKQISSDLASRVDPDSIVQSVFRTFFRRASLGQYEVAGSDDLWKLLLVISLNKIRSLATYHRADKRDISKTSALEQILQLTPSTDGDQDVAFLVLKLTVDELTEKLPDGQRAIIMLRIEGYEVAEIAERTKRSKRSVERILQNFRTLLARHLEAG